MKRFDTNKSTIILMVIGFLLATFTGLALFYYNEVVANPVISENANPQPRSYYYVMITENYASPFWKSVYASASKEAALQDAYIEMMGKESVTDYSLADMMRIAIASNVDGIILEPNGDAEIVDLINEATAKGIPVVTVLEDEAQSDRISYIGVNSYDLSIKYADQVLGLITEDTSRVLVLLNEPEEEDSLVYTQIRDQIASSRYADNQIEVDSQNIHSQSPFDSEEVIRDIMIDTANKPDILICLDAIDTECACQAVVNYNMVGKIEIIGYYSSDTILDAVQKNIVSSTFALDANQMGVNSIDALTEFYAIGRTSEYYSIDVTIIDQSNVADYIEEE